MTEQRKTIQLNPELLNIKDTTKTQKRRSSKSFPKIKIKNNVNTNTLKNRYLKHIREKQQKEYDRVFDQNKKKHNIDFKLFVL